MRTITELEADVRAEIALDPRIPDVSSRCPGKRRWCRT
jgi:hypothetical protein